METQKSIQNDIVHTVKFSDLNFATFGLINRSSIRWHDILKNITLITLLILVLEYTLPAKILKK